MSSTAIVIKSYPADSAWLQFCLRSIQKFATGFSEIIVLWPKSEEPPALTAETVVLIDSPEGYLEQQVAKLNADRHTQAEFILHFDSDCVFTHPVTPQTFLVNGKARWLYTLWLDLDGKDRDAWFNVMQKCCREAPPAEFMRKACVIIPRWAYAAFRGFIQTTHGMSMEQYVLSQPGHEFSEFNTMGFYLWLHHASSIGWHDTAASGVPKYGDIQHWSWGGLTPKIRRELEEICS